LGGPEWAAELVKPALAGREKLATILARLAAELEGLDRYERHALSRRKFAICEFDAAHGCWAYLDGSTSGIGCSRSTDICESRKARHY
jgi:hypothetical protein